MILSIVSSENDVAVTRHELLEPRSSSPPQLPAGMLCKFCQFYFDVQEVILNFQLQLKLIPSSNENMQALCHRVSLA